MATITVPIGQMIPDVAVVIANAATASGVMELKGMVPVGVKIPTMTGTTMTFTMCDTVDGTYVPVKTGTSGAALSYTIASGQWNVLDPKDFQGIKFLRAVSGSAEGAERTLLFSLKGV